MESLSNSPDPSQNYQYIDQNRMQAFAVIKNKPTPSRRITVAFQEPIHPTLEIQAIHQPTVRVSNATHIITRKRAKSANEVDDSHIINILTPRASVLEVKPVPERTFRKKPIFSKAELEEERANQETLSEVSTIRLGMSSEELSNDSQIFFTAANYRKIKGSDEPYAYTSRMKKTTQQKKGNVGIAVGSGVGNQNKTVQQDTQPKRQAIDRQKIQKNDKDNRGEAETRVKEQRAIFASAPARDDNRDQQSQELKPVYAKKPIFPTKEIRVQQEADQASHKGSGSLRGSRSKGISIIGGTPYQQLEGSPYHQLGGSSRRSRVSDLGSSMSLSVMSVRPLPPFVI